jgi:hypothetical protein
LATLLPIKTDRKNRKKKKHADHLGCSLIVPVIGPALVIAGHGDRRGPMLIGRLAG